MPTRKKTPLFPKMEDRPLAVLRLKSLIESYIADGQIQQCSDRTCGNRRDRLVPLLKFAELKRLESLDTNELRLFFQYLATGHKEPGGRFGNPRLIQAVSSGTIKSYYSTVCAFFNWLVQEEEIVRNPMDRIKPPIDRPDQIQPFTDEEVRRMMSVAKKTSNPKRDEAVLMVLLDGGLRASELCNLKVEDLNLDARTLHVEGKGGKSRMVPLHTTTQKALYNYLREAGHSEGDALFISDRGVEAGAGLCREGLGKLIKRIGDRAGVPGALCQPQPAR